MKAIIRFCTVCAITLFLLVSGALFAQEPDDGTMKAGEVALKADEVVLKADDVAIIAQRGSVPEELMRPRRDESLRYAVDMVIGSLGQGSAPVDAYTFACDIADGLISGNADAESLKSMNSVSLESYISILEVIGPRNIRLGGGRVENDGSVSFLIRFIGRELAITGEIYVRREEVPDNENSKRTVQSAWVFEDLILEDAQSRKEENDKSGQRFDFTPYHRFY